MPKKVNINGNKLKWKSFDVILWDHDIEISNVNKNPVNDSNVIEHGIHFSIPEKLFKRFERLSRKHNFEYELRKN